MTTGLKCPKCGGPAVRILQSGEVHCSNQCEEAEHARAERLDLQALTADLARVLAPALPRGTGFILVLAEFGTGGGMAYASSLERDGSISLMQELVDKMRLDHAVADHIVDTTIAKALERRDIVRSSRDLVAETIEACAKACEIPQVARGDIGESFVHAGARRCAAAVRALAATLSEAESGGAEGKAERIDEGREGKRREAQLGDADRVSGEQSASPATSPNREREPMRPDHIMQFFAYTHLPEALQKVSQPFGDLAVEIVEIVCGIPQNPERTVALRKLLEAKDAAVRAFIAKDPA